MERPFSKLSTFVDKSSYAYPTSYGLLTVYHKERKVELTIDTTLTDCLFLFLTFFRTNRKIVSRE